MRSVGNSLSNKFCCYLAGEDPQSTGSATKLLLLNFESKSLKHQLEETAVFFCLQNKKKAEKSRLHPLNVHLKTFNLQLLTASF